MKLSYTKTLIVGSKVMLDNLVENSFMHLHEKFNFIVFL